MSLSGFQRRRREAAAQATTETKLIKPYADMVKAAQQEKPFADMVKKELLAYATENGIDLGAAKTNAEMIAVIEKHEKG